MATKPTEDLSLKKSEADKNTEIDLLQEKMADVFFDMWREHTEEEQNCYNDISDHANN